MLARRTTIEALTQAAQAVGVQFQYDPVKVTRSKETPTQQAVRELTQENALGTWRFRLKPVGDHLRMWRSGCGWTPEYRPHRVNAVCWHGHRDFFRALFKIHPRCIIKTRQITYRGSKDFELNYHESDIELGSTFYPLRHSEACKCQ
jgi:hypothetical protein